MDKRDDDILTKQQISEHWPEVEKPMPKELMTWAKLKCFSRKPRSEARNIIDTRWVIKWKWDTPTTDVSTSSSATAPSPDNKEAIRTIRSRLAVREFKDQDKGDVDRYAGTSSRCSQKLLVKKPFAEDGRLPRPISAKRFSKESLTRSLQS